MLALTFDIIKGIIVYGLWLLICIFGAFWGYSLDKKAEQGTNNADGNNG